MPHLAPEASPTGEFERLRGGFGGAFAWIAIVLSVLLGLPTAFLAMVSLAAGEAPMGLCCGSSALMLALLGLWPLFRSSRYVLTNRRLLATSRFGSTIDIPLAQIDRGQITVDPLTSSLTLRGEPSASLRYIGGCRQLWSLLLLPVSHAVDEVVDAELAPDPMAAALSTPRPSQAREPDATARTNDRDAGKQHVLRRGSTSSEPIEFVHWKAVRIDGLNAQQGVAVLRPDYFAFLPVTGAHNLARMTAGVAAGVAGIHSIHLESKAPFEALFAHLSQCDALTFDAEMRRLAEEFDALVWNHGDAVVARKTKCIPFQGRYVAHVHNRETVVSGSLRQYQLPAFQRLSVLWPEIPDLEYRSASGFVFFTLLLLFFSAFSGGAIYFAIVEPNPLGTAATVLITALTLAGWFGWLRTLLPKRRAKRDQPPDQDLRRVNVPRFDR